MIAIHNFRQVEFRHRVTEAILEMLADLPEAERNIFIWNHYKGYQPKQIADVLRCSASEIEATLDAVNSILCQKTHRLRVEDARFDRETEASETSSRKMKVTLRQSVLEPVAAANRSSAGLQRLLLL